MTENVTENSNAASKQFLLHQMYIKDLSFESPNTPEVFKQVDVEMETKLNIKNSHRELGDNRFEVILHLSVHAKRGDQTVFLIEIDQV